MDKLTLAAIASAQVLGRSGKFITYGLLQLWAVIIFVIIIALFNFQYRGGVERGKVEVESERSQELLDLTGALIQT